MLVSRKEQGLADGLSDLVLPGKLMKRTITLLRAMDSILVWQVYSTSMGMVLTAVLSVLLFSFSLTVEVRMAQETALTVLQSYKPSTQTSSVLHPSFLILPCT